MTGPSPMSCETCRDLLIELVCDELAADRAAAVRAHALKCERCGPELEKLTRTLKASSSLGLLSPSPEVELRIMQAAREAIAGRARGPAREAATAATNYGGITEWFARLGSFAMSPQVAMASVLLLVVGIGLYALPFGRDAQEPSALRATEDEGDEHAAAPSPAASATATPIEQQQGERAEEQAAAARTADREPRKAPARAEKEAPALGSARARRASDGLDKAESAGRGAGSDEPMELARESKARSVSAFPGAQSAALEGKGSSGMAAKPKTGGKALSELADDFAPAPSRAGGGGAAPTDSAKKATAGKDYAQPTNVYGAPAQAPAPAKSAPAPAPAAAPAPMPRSEPAAKSAEQAKGDASSALAQGIAAIKRGDHAQGEKLLKPLASDGSGSERSTAMLWLARSLRERGDCAAALNFYRILTQAVSAPRSVLEEAADCHDRTGNRSAAERLRARAAVPVKE